MNTKRVLVAILALSLLGAPCLAGSGGGGHNETVDGVLGFYPGQEEGYIAVRVAFDQTKALSGILWYNNDGSEAFPLILVQGGGLEGPGDITGAMTVGQEVYGASSAWSELELTEPLGSATGGLYVIFGLPAYSEHEADGTGGGAAIGYRTNAESSLSGWFSDDGESWVRLHHDYELAVEAELVDVEPGMTVLSARTQAPAQPVVTETALLPASPNPFNPLTSIKFSLLEGGWVDLAIYNARGERVRSLLAETRPTGMYELIWDGTGERGQRMPSGIYFARLDAGNVHQAQRLVLVR